MAAAMGSWPFDRTYEGLKLLTCMLAAWGRFFPFDRTYEGLKRPLGGGPVAPYGVPLLTVPMRV